MAHPFVIQQPEFEALLAWLGPTRDQAGEKYELIRHQLLRYFEGHHCEPADEHVDKTIDRVAKRVAGGEQILSADPVRYFYGVAKNVFLESRKHQVASQQPRTTVFVVEPADSPHVWCLHCCLDSMTPRARDLLEAYYLDSRSGLAAREGLTPNALRLRVFKEKQKLRECVARCLQRRED
jgi:hypothetical protein